jgi:uncharacterized protein with FMN-binding domain
MMDLCWTILGILTALSAIALWKLSKKYQRNPLYWSGLILGLVLMLFSIAWATGAVLEGVPRSAGMGLLLFGFSGIILTTVCLKFILLNPIKGMEQARETEPIIGTQIFDRLPDSERGTSEKPVKDKKASDKKPSLISKFVPYIAYASLLVAYIVGMTGGSADYESMVTEKYKGRALTKIKDNPIVFELATNGSEIGEYIVISKGQGYGGPFVIGVHIGEDARIRRVMLLDNRETPAFVKKVGDARFPEQFMGKNVVDDFIPGEDVDIVSGATISTRAATQAIREAAHISALDYFKLKQSWKKEPWVFGIEEILVLILFGLAFVKQVYAKKPWKYLYMAATIGIVGFYLNSAISIGGLSGLAMGFIPDFKTHMIWWVLVVGTVLIIFIKGSNVYCYRICPFYGVGYVLNKISGQKFSPSKGVMNYSKSISNFLLWMALMIIFLSSHPAAGAFEPFAMIFSLNGDGIHWFLLPLVLVGSFFISLFWCRFFCPCGQGLSTLLRFRKKTIALIQRNK